MKKSAITSIACALLVSSLLTGTSRGQHTVVYPPHQGAYTHQSAGYYPTPVQGQGYERRHPSSIDYPHAAQSPHWKERLQYRQRAAEKPPHGCYGNFNDYSCQSLHSTKEFLFGSCRVFFGEKCLKAPPPNPIDVYRYNQYLYTKSGDHLLPSRGQIPVFGNSPETMTPDEVLKENGQGYESTHGNQSSQSCDCER